MRNLVALLIAATILAGCTRSGSAGSPSGSGARHPWTHPGILRIASLGDPDSLSPLIGTFQVDVDLSMFWAGYLFNYDDRNQLVPELATSVPTLANGGIAQDGRTITYHLRRGVLWQDGATFSADDVVFSWHAVMNPNTNVQTRTGYDDIRAIDEPDKYTLVVHLIRPFAPFVNSFFTMGATPYPVYPKHLLAQYGTSTTFRTTASRSVPVRSSSASGIAARRCAWLPIRTIGVVRPSCARSTTPTFRTRTLC